MQRVFAVDIGTRSVIGLTGYYEDGSLIIEHGEVEYHKDRVMIDGQIHDIEGVTESIKVIKEKLETKCGQRLTDVAIAAAGRSLITGRAELEQEIDHNKPIEKHIVDALESECLNLIYNQLLEQSQDIKDYFCIGHTVVHYYINDAMMLSLIGHRGRTIKVDLIATFLPRTVVESLYASVSNIGLNVSYLTLEPIAAIEAAVPANMRLLNIALVDIGAGTSDIAITKDGTVVAYAMTSTAGDEVTEAIAQAYLLDFDSAEALKCKLNQGAEQHTFTDIIGLQHTVASEEILDTIQEVIELIAKNIADNILERNNKAPSAVFLTGGGSKLPRLSQAIASYLQLPVGRVATRDLATIPKMTIRHFEMNGPEVMTPIGILIKAAAHLGKDFVEVTVNGDRVKLINTKALQVIDALMLIGFNPQQLIARAGQSMEITINGRTRTIFGEPGQPGEICVNNQLASISTPIKLHDDITITPAIPGKPKELTVGQLFDMNAGFYWNEQWVQTTQSVTINGTPAADDRLITADDSVTVLQLVTLTDVYRHFNIPPTVRVLVNGLAMEMQYRIQPRDSITVEREVAGEDEDEVEVKDEVKAVVKDEVKAVVAITAVNEQSPAVVPEEQHQPQSPTEPFIHITYNGGPLSLPYREGFTFIHLFDYIDFDRTQVHGSLRMTLNGEPAAYYEKIQDGDAVIIEWTAKRET